MRRPRTAQGGAALEPCTSLMSLVERLFRKRGSATPPRPLYAAIIAEARDPVWYRDGAVADTLDGRFEMVATVLGLVLLRLEREGEAGREPAARVAELFVDDMDGQLREIGIGDLVVGKHVGRMMAALGGRLGAYRDGLAAPAGTSLEEALLRNLYRNAVVPAEAAAFSAARVRTLARRLDVLPLDALLEGRLG